MISVGTKIVASVSLICAASFASARISRGYVTTPAELQHTAAQARLGLQPYKASLEQVVAYASGSRYGPHGDPAFWPYMPVREVSCKGSERPEFLYRGSPLIEAKAIAFHLTSDPRFARSARQQILSLATTHGYGSSRDCVCQLAWYTPGWVIAADLLEGFKEWTDQDRTTFQQWLANTVYPRVAFASQTRSNNIGAAASATAAIIADYLSDSSVPLQSPDGKTISSQTAFQKAKQNQLDRINGNEYMRHEPGCPPGDRLVGIRPDGGIPWELARGATGCDGAWFVENDESWGYQQVALQGLVLHAELLLRRNDPSLYENQTPSGAGSIRRAVLFVLQDPHGSGMTAGFHRSHLSVLEFAYRYYRDPRMAAALRVGSSERVIAGASDQMLHFGTVTHGFAAEETSSLHSSD